MYSLISKDNKLIRLTIVSIFCGLFILGCSSSSESQSPSEIDTVDDATTNIDAGDDTSESALSNTSVPTIDSSQPDEPDDLTALLPDAVQATLEIVPIKTFRISWQPSTNANFYRVLEDTDGASGFSQISDDLDSSTLVFDHSISLYARINSRYIVQSCNESGCVDSIEQTVSGTLENAIGYFKADVPFIEDRFGNSVSLSSDGNTLAVGVVDRGAENIGGAFVFERIDGRWQQQAFLQAESEVTIVRFGRSILLSDNGDKLVVGAQIRDLTPPEPDSPNGFFIPVESGTVFVFERSDGVWQQQASLLPQSFEKDRTLDGDSTFGARLSMSADGTLIAVNARFDNSIPNVFNESGFSIRSTGVVYVFETINNVWQQQALIQASNAESFDMFGSSLSLSANGQILAVGARDESSASTGIDGDMSNNSSEDSGAVYVFTRNGETWQQQTYLKASNSNTNFEFGSGVSLNSLGNLLAVSAPGENEILGNSGAIYIFGRDDQFWQQQALIRADGLTGNFNNAVSMDAEGSTLVVGASEEDTEGFGVHSNQTTLVASIDSDAANSGAAYVFEQINGVWRQRAYLKASNAGRFDRFGTSVSIAGDGNAITVGAWTESGGSGGINGEQTDNSIPLSGAVYLY